LAFSRLACTCFSEGAMGPTYILENGFVLEFCIFSAERAIRKGQAVGQ
jgi:hypothetical protein